MYSIITIHTENYLAATKFGTNQTHLAYRTTIHKGLN